VQNEVRDISVERQAAVCVALCLWGWGWRNSGLNQTLKPMALQHQRQP